MSKILINAITIEEANLTPLLLRIQFWYSQRHHITILGNDLLKKRIPQSTLKQIDTFLSLSHASPTTGKMHFAVESLRRNIVALVNHHGLGNSHDVIYTVSSVADLVLYPAILKVFYPKTRWLTVFDNTVSFNGPGNKIVRYLAYAFYRISLVLLRKADVIFVITKELKRELTRIGFNDEKLVITGNAVEDDLIRNIKRPSNPQIDCLFIGRINETKGIYDLLEVAKIITKHKPDFSLHMMGRGDRSSETRFKNMLKKTSLDKNINLIGFKSGIEKFKIIKSSKCFLFLSPSESFGVAVLEAVCCGLPTLVYELDVYKKLYKNREVMMFKPGEYQQIAKKILDIMADKKYTNPAGEKLLPKYSWNRIAQIELNKF